MIGGRHHSPGNSTIDEDASKGRITQEDRGAGRLSARVCAATGRSRGH